MYNFLNIEKSKDKCEFIVDTKLFDKDNVLKTAYVFLDRAYFFFKLDDNGNIVVQFTIKDREDIENVIVDFSDELLAVYLRNKLEKENKKIREAIVTAAISNSLDESNFVSINSDNTANQWWLEKQEQNQVDFDKDIDEILKEIENDPELKIDEEEVEKILKEIENETESEISENDNK